MNPIHLEYIQADADAALVGWIIIPGAICLAVAWTLIRWIALHESQCRQRVEKARESSKAQAIICERELTNHSNRVRPVRCDEQSETYALDNERIWAMWDGVEAA